MRGPCPGGRGFPEKIDSNKVQNADKKKPVKIEAGGLSTFTGGPEPGGEVRLVSGGVVLFRSPLSGGRAARCDKKRNIPKSAIAIFHDHVCAIARGRIPVCGTWLRRLAATLLLPGPCGETPQPQRAIAIHQSELYGRLEASARTKKKPVKIEAGGLSIFTGCSGPGGEGPLLSGGVVLFAVRFPGGRLLAATGKGISQNRP